MDVLKPRLQPLSLGSVPIAQPDDAWDLVLGFFPDTPTWPQLPKRSFLENMYVQFSAGFPCVVLEHDRIFVDRTLDLDPGLEQLYIAYLSDQVDAFQISRGYAAGLWETERALDGKHPGMLKGQVTGPISWGLMVVDQERRPVLYDDVLADAVARHLRMKAAWQERFLRRFCPQTLITLDEPYLASFGSAFVAIDQSLVLDLLDETLAGIQGWKGLHCCGNTDWGMLLSTSIDVLSLDAYQFADNLALYPEELDAFLGRGGVIAWGLVPTGSEVENETPDTLLDRFETSLLTFEQKGIARERILEVSFLTPSCGVGGLTPAQAERVFSMARDLSDLARERYLGIQTSAE